MTVQILKSIRRASGDRRSIPRREEGGIDRGHDLRVKKTPKTVDMTLSDDTINSIETDLRSKIAMKMGLTFPRFIYRLLL